MKHPLVFLILLGTFLSFYRIWDKEIIFTDELYIEEVAYTMSETGSYIIPKVNGSVDLLKPPLLYWLTAPLYLVFTPSPWVRRFWTAIFTVLLVLVTYKLAYHFFDKKTAFWSSLFLATSIPFIYFSKTGNWDLPNSFFITTTIYFYNLKEKNKKYLFFSAVILALGILTRSFLSLLPLAILFVDYILFPKTRPKLLMIIAYILILIIITLPWHIFAFQSEPQIFKEQYLKIPLIYHALYTIPGEQVKSRLFYLNTFLLFPLSFFAFWGIVKKFFLLNRYVAQLFSWVVILAFILVISPSKNEWYIIPIYPALSILSAFSFVKLFSKIKKGSILYNLTSLFLFTLLISPPIALLFSPLPQSEAITATSIMDEKSKPDDILYVWRYEIVPITRFYPNRLVKIIDSGNLTTINNQTKPIFILIQNSELKSLPKDTIIEPIFPGKELSLVKLKLNNPIDK